MLLHIPSRTILVLFFSRPQTHPNRPPGLHLERVEDSHDFHSYRDTSAVVSSTGPRCPGIKVSTEHDNLIFQLWISTGNLGDGVETMLVVTGNLRIDVQLDY